MNSMDDRTHSILKQLEDENPLPSSLADEYDRFVNFNIATLIFMGFFRVFP